MQTIPISAVMSQTFSVNLAGQACQISLRQRTTGLFMDLSANSAPIVSGILCRDRTLIVQSAYLGFIGDVAFYDIKLPLYSGADPAYFGLGTRFPLVYLTPADLAVING